jgi:predicted nucleic acid-binding protein
VNKGLLDDRYNAACSWALANETDSAFALLFLIVKKGNYTDYDQLINDNDLKPLYNDSRWEEIKSIIKSNKEKKEVNYKQ